MKRIEIIISRALDEEFLERISAYELTHFTAITPVIGQGFSNPKLGNEVWPQTNKLYIFYVKDEDVVKLTKIVIKLREEFPTEGLAAFESEARCLSECSELYSKK
jgi:nitrogen regulatory protein PII